ncbi:hypothetical protein [Verrucosispora sp. WMMD573]|uniref:hypothetical protein n=1 Tax=Verrucosispora sp. WMMD573 TaxID=3015149 RepID=UPI00248B4AD4|nr:hypothetical protein [Verrucosispora sp. WMMD573]WBB53198.1 hypothetical protein O7601_21885 [Verrucosispora sp. WMMD573]
MAKRRRGLARAVLRLGFLTAVAGAAWCAYDVASTDSARAAGEPPVTTQDGATPRVGDLIRGLFTPVLGSDAPAPDPPPPPGPAPRSADPHASDPPRADRPRPLRPDDRRRRTEPPPPKRDASPKPPGKQAPTPPPGQPAEAQPEPAGGRPGGRQSPPVGGQPPQDTTPPLLNSVLEGADPVLRELTPVLDLLDPLLDLVEPVLDVLDPVVELPQPAPVPTPVDPTPQPAPDAGAPAAPGADLVPPAPEVEPARPVSPDRTDLDPESARQLGTADHHARHLSGYPSASSSRSDKGAVDGGEHDRSWPAERGPSTPPPAPGHSGAEKAPTSHGGPADMAVAGWSPPAVSGRVTRLARTRRRPSRSPRPRSRPA